MISAFLYNGYGLFLSVDFGFFIQVSVVSTLRYIEQKTWIEFIKLWSFGNYAQIPVMSKDSGLSVPLHFPIPVYG